MSEWNRLQGYMGCRMAKENEIAEAMGLEPGDYESFSRPTFTWINAEEAEDPGQEIPPGDDSLLWTHYDPFANIDDNINWHKVRRDWFFARVQESRDMKTLVLDALKKVTRKSQLYAMSDVVAKFDRATSSWMFDEDECSLYDLRPLELLYTHVERAFDKAERRVRRIQQAAVLIQSKKETPWDDFAEITDLEREIKALHLGERDLQIASDIAQERIEVENELA